MAYRNFKPIIGTIINMARGNDCCSQMMSLRTENGIVNFMITSDTRIIDNRPLRPGLRVAAFYDASLPVPVIRHYLSIIRRQQEAFLRRQHPEESLYCVN